MRAVFVLLHIALAAASNEQDSSLWSTEYASGLNSFSFASEAWHPKVNAMVKEQEISMTKVATLCVGIFSIIAVLWILFSRLSKETPNYDMFRIGLNGLSYAGCAISMHAMNKTLATTLKEPSLISIVHEVVAVSFFVTIAGRQLMECDRKALQSWCVVPVFFAAVLISSLYTYEYISLSMLTIMRNCAPLIVLPMETIFMPAESRPTTNTMSIGCMLVMLFGAILYGGALEVSMVGVLCAIINMAIAVTDRLIQRRLLTEQCKSLPSTVCAILNNGLALIPTMLLAGFSHELEHATSAKMAQHWTNPVVLMFLIASGFIGMGVGYFGTECQRDLTATSFFVMGNATKCGVVLLGITVFGDSFKSGHANLGLLMSLTGSALYGHAQMQIGAEAKEKQKLLNEDEKASA